MTVSKGDRVKVHYEGSMENGEIFDKSEEDKPLEFVVGSGQIIPGFDKAVTGMKEGEEKEVTISPEDAYGERSEDLFIDVPRSKLPEGVDPEVGMHLQTQDPGTGKAQIVRVAELGEETIKIDANHPLAGKNIKFKIQVVGIN